MKTVSASPRPQLGSRDPNAIQAIGVDKAFGRIKAVSGATVEVGRGQLVALLGPSGSGKTTLLRTIAGFEAPDAGAVWIGDHQVAGEGVWEEPDRRRIGMVFQDGALFPHLTLAGNVAFGRADEHRVSECLDLVGLAHRSSDYPHELSGGERQRVALARALAPEPEVVLLDEPFASLDPSLRETLREEVTAILRAADASALLVTHSQEEALSLADVVTVMRDGHIEQTGTPEDVYHRPATRWVASFLGEADVVPGTAAHGVVACELGRFSVDDGLRGPVQVVLRPESVTIAACDGGRGMAEASIVRRSFYGHDQLVVLELASGVQVRSRSLGSSGWRPGDRVEVKVEGPVNVFAPATPEEAEQAPRLTV